jgi:FKBP-type peptidyl-prolyl cis-trans isomerase
MLHMMRGVRILEEQPGRGAAAEKQDTVCFELEIALNQGEIVCPRQEFTSVLGSRQLVAGVEKALVGMKVGGYRKVKISPHLAYRETGVQGKIPPGALLLCQVWLKRVIKPHRPDR